MSYDPKQRDPKRKPPQKDPDNKKRTKSILTMVVVALVFTVIVNLVYTAISNSLLQKITFSEFEDMKDSQQLAEVEIRSDRLMILTKEEAEKEDSKQIVYFTGRPDDISTSKMMEDLRAADVETDIYIQEEMNQLSLFDFIETEIGTITMLISDLEQNLKYIYRDAYQKGRNDAIEQMIHG